jgi:hypothetical protein
MDDNMPRSARNLSNVRHHLMNRSPARRALFLDDAGCQRFLDSLATVAAAQGVRVVAYTLMPDHYHLLVIGDPESVKGMRSEVEVAFFDFLHEEKGWQGPVFEAQPKQRIIVDGGMWRHLMAWIHLNPVRWGLCPKPELARWTSYPAAAGLGPVPEFLDLREQLAAFGGPEMLVNYTQLVASGVEQGPPEFNPDDLWGVLGLPRLVTAPVMPPLPAPPVSGSRPSGRRKEGRSLQPPTSALTQAAVVTGESVSALLKGKRGRGGYPARWVASWWLVETTPLNQNGVAELFRTSPAAISHTLDRVRTSPSDEVQAWVSALERHRP